MRCSLNDLWCHENFWTHHWLEFYMLLRNFFAKAKINNFRVFIFFNHNILRFKVSMHNTIRMDMIERFKNSIYKSCSVSFLIRAFFLYFLIQVRSFDVLHYYIEIFFIFKRLNIFDYMRMVYFEEDIEFFTHLTPDIWLHLFHM